MESRTLGFQTGLQHLQYARDLSVKVPNVSSPLCQVVFLDTFGNDTKRLQSWLPEVERVIEMEPRNKQALIWIIAFFLILNVGLGLFALMAA